MTVDRIFNGDLPIHIVPEQNIMLEGWDSIQDRHPMWLFSWIGSFLRSAQVRRTFIKKVESDSKAKYSKEV